MVSIIKNLPLLWRSKKDLKLSDRIFQMHCGYVEDRDLNAALNLRDAKTYEVA